MPTPPTNSALLGKHLATCHRCDRRQAECAGACTCNEDGRDILLHAREGNCPLGRFEAPACRGLGDYLAKCIAMVGGNWVARRYERITGKPCGCQRRREKLNQLLPMGHSQPIE